MEFSKKIQELRNRAQETQAANRIIDMLTQLKLKNDDTTSHRWIWELIQNAKDVVNSIGMVDIIINFDEGNKSIEFKHNGKLFSTENIVFLIEQVSTKDRTITDSKNKRTTGKFGTGFLTTHLLSEKVRVSGYLQDVSEQPCSFSVVLDRSGTDKRSIINAIQESCSQLDKSTTMTNGKIINEKNFNTCFTYILDESGVLTAKKGLKNLLISAPYVFAFVPEISSITVTSGQYIQKISRGEIIKTDLENAEVTRIAIVTKNKNKDRYICVLGTYDLSIAMEVETHEKYNFIAKFDPQLPRIFCDFPLLGTNDFSFPVVINSSLFNPTEPRNGIHLTDKGHEQITENKQRLVEACQLYIKMLDYFLGKGYEGIYNIVKIPEQPDKDWISKEWFEQEVIDSLKSHIKEIPLVYAHSGEKRPLFDDWGDPCVLIPKDADKTVRDKVWALSSKIIPHMITKREELECWYNSLWGECRNYSIADLIERVETFNNIDELSKNVIGNVADWLNEFIGVILCKRKCFC
ncbi:MAG: Histidine kinase-, DNA gyrase B-, and HSP90-like ATPase [Pelotomaculum sp. PtaB.Bin104]|nr:MAG: Histidine kinase-, DNA gyrase B-, and HSP90-like ATPase [Pelotomaculum sp. PtaB.Bin104]